MGEPTKNRKQLRRAVSKASKSRFFRTYSAGEIPLTGDTDALTASSLPSTDYLVQPDNHWKNSFVYVVDTEEERPIAAFDSGLRTLYTEYPLTTVPRSTDSMTIEIHDRWSPGEIHDAINWSIEEAGKKFPDSVEDDTLVLLEDTLQYDISGLSKAPWLPLQVWVERTASSMTGTATAGDTDGITVPSDLSDVTTGWKVSVYGGTGKQQVADVTAVSTTTQVVSALFATAPGSDSKYRLWDAAEEKYEWDRIAAVKFDQPEFPTHMRFVGSYPSLLGLRVRVVYLSVPSILEQDADTTVVPEQYIVHKSLSYLHDLMVQDVRADRQMHANAAEYHDVLADKFMALHIRRRTAGTWWQEEDSRAQAGMSNDPMGWGY